MSTLPLTKGKFALVDDADYEWLSQWKWYYDGLYPVRNSKGGVKRYKILMHREIMQTPEGKFTDHANGDKCDNRRSNLRVCTNSQNNCNQRIGRANTTGFKGVYYYKKNRQFAAKLGIDNKEKYLGLYPTAEAAFAVRCEAALKYHGEFARAR